MRPDVGGFYRDTRDDALCCGGHKHLFFLHIPVTWHWQPRALVYSVDAEKAVAKALNLRYQLITYLKDSC